MGVLVSGGWPGQRVGRAAVRLGAGVLRGFLGPIRLASFPPRLIVRRSACARAALQGVAWG
eukprot:15430759-Alexandrium_andersonii.AAC.1